MTVRSTNPDAVLVTGAARGIGAAVAAAMAETGRPVTLLDRDESVHDTAARLRAQGATAAGRVADVTEPEAVRAAVAAAETDFGPIGVLVNAAGVLRVGGVLESDDEDWGSCLGVNATGVWNVSRAVGARMYARRAGSIVTVASNAASVPRVGMAAYGASKAAAKMITLGLGLELAPHVRCNVVAPGSTDTPMLNALLSESPEPDPTAVLIAGCSDTYKLGIPLQRIAAPADVADVVMFLATDAARHITLQTLTVDGGATLGA